MRFRVGWGRGIGSAVVQAAGELDGVLDSVQAGPDDLPYCVTIWDADDSSTFPVTLQICVGDPERSFAYHVGTDGSSAWAYQPGVEPGHDLVFDYSGQATDAWPERTRVTPAAARRAAREFVAGGGERPPSLQWDTSEQ